MSNKLDFSQWFDSDMGRNPKVMRYRGGMAATEVYVFPQRKHIDAELIKVGGKNLLDQFNNSSFGKSLTEGGIKMKSSKKLHRISAFSTVSGWRSNQELWDNHMKEHWNQDFSFNWKALGDPSVLTIAGALFGSDDNPIPFELRQDLLEWVKRRGSYISDSICDAVDVTGMTVHDYGIALRISNYDLDMVAPAASERRMRGGFASFRYEEGIKVVSEISAKLRSINNSSCNTWGWICAMKNDSKSRREIIDSIYENAKNGITPLTYHKIYSQGVTENNLIKLVATGEIDLELALRLDEE